MKIVFFGSSEFALPSLKALIESEHKVLAVVTQPDREKGRHRDIVPTPVKEIAVKNKIPLFQPENVSDDGSSKYLKKLRADLFVVVSFGQILSGKLLAIPRTYSINIHPSALPKYRGAAPANWAIIKGEEKTALTAIRMNEKMDAGDIIMQRKVPIEKSDNAVTLLNKLAYLGSILLIDTIRFIEMDKVIYKKQNTKKSTLAPKLKKEDGLIDWKKPAQEIHNLVRGLVPWPSAYTLLGEKTLKIYKSETLIYYEKPEPGKVVDTKRDSISVSCGKNLLIIRELQLEGGKRMDAASFLRGHKLEKGTVLGS